MNYIREAFVQQLIIIILSTASCSTAASWLGRRYAARVVAILLGSSLMCKKSLVGV